jgi:hypothetical protein
MKARENELKEKLRQARGRGCYIVNDSKITTEAEHHAKPETSSEQPAAGWHREYLRKYYRRHRNAETLTPEDLEQCRQKPALAREIRGDGVVACLECGLLVKYLPPHLPGEHGMRSKEYKRKWDLPNNYPLAAKGLSAKLAQIKTAAGHLPPVEKRFGQPGVSSQQLAWKARRERGGSLVERQARQDRMLADARTGKARQLHPDFWAKVRARKISRADIVERRMRGQSVQAIGRDLKVNRSSVDELLRRMGVPSASFVLWHGEPLCWRHLPLLIQDYIAVKHLAPPRLPILALRPHQTFTLLQSAALLDVSRDWVVKWKDLLHLDAARRGAKRGRRIYLANAQVQRLAAERDRIREWQILRHARREITRALHANPVWISIRSKDESKVFSAGMSNRIFSFWSGLQNEWHRQSSSLAGGRPQKLLPSEKASLPRRYQSLRKELNRLRRVLRQKDVRPNLRAIQEWICEQAMHGRMRTLLLWPKFFAWARQRPEWHVSAGNWAPNDLAIEFLASAFAVGRETIRRSLLQQPS